MAFELTQLLSLIKPIGECILKYIKPILYSPAIQKLRSQESVSFKEISDAIGKDENEPYSPEEVFHHLLRALWRGEFENKKGESRLWLRNCNGPLSPGLKGQMFYKNENKNPAPPKKEAFNRRRLLLCPGIEIDHIYVLPLQLLNNDQLPWETVKNVIKWEVLALIEPQNYGERFITSYLKELRMPQKDFKKWLKNFRKGKYAQ